uniref:Uncharacterized protein n=1 Tax=Amphimedon queenslandica TaxID=400682 RepID=A0A1X7UEE0_AMPQE
MVFYELPQELGDYVIFWKFGLYWSVALFFNFLSSLTFLVSLLVLQSVQAEVKKLAVTAS